MSGLSTDPKMMRAQQDKDTPETIEADETHRPEQRHDSDAASAAARTAAKAQPIADPADGQNAVFAANRAAFGIDDTPGVDAQEAGPLAQKDRSLLGS